MPLLKSKSRKNMSKNIKTEMDAGKPQKQSIAIAYDVMRRARKNKMAQGGLTKPDSEKSLMESKLSDHFPTYDTRKQKDPEGYTSSNKLDEHPEHMKDNTDPEDESLQERMISRPNDKEDRSLTLFDGEAERKDPMDKELEEDEDADDIVGRIMKKMRRK